MKKKIICVLSLLLCLNLCTTVFAWDAGPVDNPGDIVITPNPGGGGGEKNPPPVEEEPANPYSPVGKKNPYVSYFYTSKDGNLVSSLKNFTENNGGKMVYSSRQKTEKFMGWSNGGNKWYLWYSPNVVFNSCKDYHNVETKRETDYYTWKCNGPNNWEVKEGRYKSAIFTKVGKYTITSVPHQLVTNAKWNTYSGKAYDIFSDGTTNTITEYYKETPKEYNTTGVDRTDLRRTWILEIGPEEIGKEIPLNPDKVPKDGDRTPIEIDPSSVDWDTQLIQ